MNERQKNQIIKKQLELRKRLWPDIDEATLWHKKRGWLTIPRVMPIISQIMNALSKGKPIFPTYLDLWCRTFDNSFVIANKHSEMAFSAGFTGERAIRTWQDRIKTLEKLGFIRVADGPSGKISYILILNPFQVIKTLEQEKQVTTSVMNALHQRMIEVGADDMDEK